MKGAFPSILELFNLGLPETKFTIVHIKYVAPALLKLRWFFLKAYIQTKCNANFPVIASEKVN